MLKNLIFPVLLIFPACLLSNATAQTPPAEAPPLAITTESLPEAAPQQPYWERLRSTGGIPSLHWSLVRGELPPGLELQDDGTISGVPKAPGEFRFTAEVTDSAQPPNRIHRQFTITVMTPLTLDWNPAPRVQDTRIEGGVKVTNGTKETFELTVIVVAVNEVGKAFALGYQRLDFKAGTANFQIPFGSTLPQGAYVVHADAVAELAPRNVIYRKRLHTPAPLQVTVGP